MDGHYIISLGLRLAYVPSSHFFRFKPVKLSRLDLLYLHSGRDSARYQMSGSNYVEIDAVEPKNRVE